VCLRYIYKDKSVKKSFFIKIKKRSQTMERNKKTMAACEGLSRRLPKSPGSYGLIMELESPLALSVSSLQTKTLAAGRYLYAGSAKGSGGINARVRRHLKKDKPLHWHIDRLTKVADVCGVLVLPGGRECSIIDALAGVSGVFHPAPGFGGSDCRNCPSHLLQFSDGLDVSSLVGTILREAEAEEPGFFACFQTDF
jgi:Uri superfamily endonuclease